MGHRIDVSFFDLLNDESKNEGLKKLRDANQAGMHCIVIVCGGDGTVMWVVEQIVKMKINIHDIPVGIIPIGTGNDFSRALGWGGKQ
jgi:diacylglycerol kinase (ATP)